MSRLPIVLLAAVCLAGACSALSIENTPVKVTHRNSGPRYDLEEEVDKSKLAPVFQTAPETNAAAASEPTSDKKQEDDNSNSNSNKDADSGEPTPFRHISIRRIFLVPMVRPRPEWQEEAGESGPPASRQPLAGDDESSGQERPGMFAKPFWPFMTPARHSHPSHHMFGADEASRSPSEVRAHFQRGEEKPEPEREGERESEPQEPARAAGNEREQFARAIQMMLEMTQHFFNSQLGQPMQPNSPDLNREASSTRDDGNPSKGEQQPSEERPKIPTELAKPAASNETREDIVEIEGKKYLRKAIIIRHVGENIIFLTKRLILVPFNETNADSASEQPSIPTTTGASTSSSDPTTTTVAPSFVSEVVTSSTAAASSELPTEAEKSPSTEKPVEESTTTTTMAAPTTVAATEPAAEQESTTKNSFVERVAEAIEKLDRIVEGPNADSSTTTTEKPASS